MSYQPLFRYTLTDSQLATLRKTCTRLDITSKALVARYGGRLIEYNVLKFRKEEEFTWFLLSLT
jgi:hypothetical protein